MIKEAPERNAHIHIRIADSELSRMKTAARKEGVKFSSWVRIILRQELDKAEVRRKRA